ncbi:MAG: carotenoid 1,2-hydratase [Actinobacteria bacterium]|nr:carotenoid 1,2-hydratase [Actinomycetota bacterium]
MSRPGLWRLILLLPVFLLAGCAAPAPGSPLKMVTAPPPTPVVPRPISLPADEAPHNDLTEWWYYTGHLKTESGKKYGFELVFFQGVRGQNPVGYAAHFAITDHQRQTFSFAEKVDQSLRVQGDGRYQLVVDGWKMGGNGDDDYLQAQGNGYAINLKLHSEKPPVLHNGIGWLSFGPVGDSYYYSRTRMEVEGTLQDGDTTERVTGLAWMDHQWGNFILVNGGGWDWYSVQLGDGTELMVTVLRDQPGNVAAIYGSYVDRQGRTTNLKAGDLEVRATGSWKSPRSGATYPSGWKLRLPGQHLDLTLEPVLKDQELNTTRGTGVSYWEGEVRVSGSRGGSPITGEGYVELTGYAK